MAYEYLPGKVHLMLTQAVKDAVMYGKEWKHMHYTIRKSRRKRNESTVYYGFDLLVHDRVIAFVVPSAIDDSILCVYITTEANPTKMYCDVLNDVFTALGMGAPFTWVINTKNRYPYIHDGTNCVRYDRYMSYLFEPKF